jgi:benzaldehyde dehydrogenase (NAD)
MNAPAGKFLIEDTWRGRVFGTEWRSAAGGSLDVLEPATGAKITSVGNATAADVRKAAAEARAAQPGWAATMKSAPPSCARRPACSKTIRRN